RAVSTIACPPVTVATLLASATATPPRSSISLTVRSAGPAHAPGPSTAPGGASRRARSRPSPPPAPVTTATLSSKRMSAKPRLPHRRHRTLRYGHGSLAGSTGGRAGLDRAGAVLRHAPGRPGGRGAGRGPAGGRAAGLAAAARAGTAPG